MRLVFEPLDARPVPAPPRRVWWDWAVVGALAVGTSAEAILRDDLPWPIAWLAVASALAGALLWRRSRPLTALLAAFGAVAVVDAAQQLLGRGAEAPSSTAFVLLLPYAVVRWGTWRRAAIGFAVLLTWLWATVVAWSDPLTDGLIGSVIFLLSGALGAALRFRARSLQQEAEQVRAGERERLAEASGAGPRVDVTLSGDLDDLTPAIGTAAFRLAQESITNALRHAREATRIEVRVVGRDATIHLTIRDDGRGAPTRGGSGYGLVGMTERAALLGGPLDAGPGSDGGWTVDAVLPRVRVSA